MKILVVDDEKDIKTLFEQRFRKEIKSNLVEFVFAFSGEEALELMKDLKPNSTPHSIYHFDSVFNDLKQNKLNGLNSLIW